MPIKSRRKHQRTHFISTIKYYSPGSEKSDADGVSVDISRGGLGMITNYPLGVGHVLIFEDTLKTNSISEKASIVRWAKEIEKNRYRVGLEFVR